LIHGFGDFFDVTFDLVCDKQHVFVELTVFIRVFFFVEVEIEHLPAREKSYVALLDHVADFEFNAVEECLVLFFQVHDELELELPVVVLADVLVEADALLLQRVALQFADEADVVDVVLEFVVVVL